MAKRPMSGAPSTVRTRIADVDGHDGKAVDSFTHSVNNLITTKPPQKF